MRINDIKKSEAGVSLAETVVAVAIMGLAMVFLANGLGLLSRSDLIVKDRTTAEGLARSQMEIIKSQGYIDWISGHGEYQIIAAPTGYGVQTSVVPINPATGASLASGDDDGVQRIGVTVIRNSETLFTLTGYKVDR